MRGDGTILPSVPWTFGSGMTRSEVGSDGGVAECGAEGCETGDGALEAWLLAELGLLTGDGLLDGDGLLGALL